MLPSTNGSMDSSRKVFTQHVPRDQAQFWALLRTQCVPCPQSLVGYTSQWKQVACEQQEELVNLDRDLAKTSPRGPVSWGLQGGA